MRRSWKWFLFHFRPFFTLRTRFLVFESMMFCACFLISSRVNICTSSSPDDSSSERSPGARVAWAAGDLMVEKGEISSTREIAHEVKSSPALCLAPSRPWAHARKTPSLQRKNKPRRQASWSSCQFGFQNATKSGWFVGQCQCPSLIRLHQPVIGQIHHPAPIVCPQQSPTCPPNVARRNERSTAILEDERSRER